MGNNSLRKYIVSLLLFMFCLSSYGQNIKRYYLSKAQDKGTIYHFLPVFLFQDAEGEKFLYDLTYTDWNNTITMNFTYVKKEPLAIDSIRYVSGEVEILDKADKIYVEPTSKKWVHRYSLKGKADNFFRLYNGTVTPEITLYSNGKKYIYNVNKSAWRKYVPIGQKIFKMINL